MVTSQTSPPPSNASYQPQTSSPIHQPVPLNAPVMPLVSQSAEVNSARVGPKNEEEDSLSDAGTYTIETDVPDKELEDARSKIDQARLFSPFNKHKWLKIVTSCVEEVSGLSMSHGRWQSHLSPFLHLSTCTALFLTGVWRF